MFDDLSITQIQFAIGRLKKDRGVHELNCSDGLPEATESVYDLAIEIHEDEINRRNRDA